MSGSQQTYSAAQLREALSGRMDDQDVEELFPHAGLVVEESPREFLNHMARIFNEADDEDLPDEFTDLALYDQIVRSEGTNMATEAVEFGNVSQMQHVVGMVDSSSNRDDDPKSRMADTLAREGAIVMVQGEPGSGKTSTTIDAAMMAAIQENATIVTNIRSWTAVDDENIVQDSEELKDRLGEIEGRVIVVIDEAARCLRQGTGSGNQQKAEKYAQDLKWVRKKEEDDRYPKRGSVALITHTSKGAGAEIRRVCVERWIKTSAKDPGRVTIQKLDQDGNPTGKDEEFKGISDTNQTYNEHEQSWFDVPLSDDEDGENDAESVEDVERRNAIATVIRARVTGQATTHGEAANLVSYSQSWCGDRWREFANDEMHREIVDDEILSRWEGTE